MLFGIGQSEGVGGGYDASLGSPHPSPRVHSAVRATGRLSHSFACTQGPGLVCRASVGDMGLL